MHIWKNWLVEVEEIFGVPKLYLDGDKGVLESSRYWRIAEVHQLCFSNCTVVWLV